MVRLENHKTQDRHFLAFPLDSSKKFAAIFWKLRSHLLESSQPSFENFAAIF